VCDLLAGCHLRWAVWRSRLDVCWGVSLRRLPRDMRCSGGRRCSATHVGLAPRVVPGDTARCRSVGVTRWFWGLLSVVAIVLWVCRRLNGVPALRALFSAGCGFPGIRLSGCCVTCQCLLYVLIPPRVNPVFRV